LTFACDKRLARVLAAAFGGKSALANYSQAKLKPVPAPWRVDFALRDMLAIGEAGERARCTLFERCITAPLSAPSHATCDAHRHELSHDRAGKFGNLNAVCT